MLSLFKNKLLSIGITVGVFAFVFLATATANAACTSDTATIELPATSGAYGGTITAAWTPNNTYDTCVFDVEYRREGDVVWTSIGSSVPGGTTYAWNTVVATTARGENTDYQFRIKLGAAQLALTGNFALDQTAPINNAITTKDIDKDGQYVPPAYTDGDEKNCKIGFED